MAEDGDYIDVGRSEMRKAAKAHRCDECGRTIAAGEQYRVSVCLYNGQWDTDRMCAHCDVGRAWLAAECGGWLYGAVAEDVREHWVESDLLRSYGMARWLVGHDRRWRRRDGSLMPIPSPIPMPALP